MKTLEEVIKNKNRLIGGKESIYGFREQLLQNLTGKPIYLVDNLNDKNIIELIQEITPLIYYLISSLKNEEENLLRELIIELEFPPCESHLRFSGRFKINDENPLNSIKNFKDFEDEGHFLTFTRHFNLLFLLKKSQNSEPLREESEQESEEESEEEKIINTSKSFKSDECVICLTEPPNVFFCNCGHLCLCTECNKIEFLEQCPICKTENTILRIIE